MGFPSPWRPLEQTIGKVDDSIGQSNEVNHTDKKAVERLFARPQTVDGVPLIQINGTNRPRFYCSVRMVT
jgi:hypothetical protein